MSEDKSKRRSAEWFGKGDKERLVPMGEEALLWLQRYLAGPRAELLKGVPCDVVFPSTRAANDSPDLLASY